MTKTDGNKKHIKKHLRIKNKFRFITFVTILLLICSFTIGGFVGGVAASDKQEYVTIKVLEGDTLWSLAKEFGPSNVDCRKVIYQIEKINNVTADSLQAGQYITIPTNKL